MSNIRIWMKPSKVSPAACFIVQATPVSAKTIPQTRGKNAQETEPKRHAQNDPPVRKTSYEGNNPPPTYLAGRGVNQLKNIFENQKPEIPKPNVERTTTRESTNAEGGTKRWKLHDENNNQINPISKATVETLQVPDKPDDVPNQGPLSSSTEPPCGDTHMTERRSSIKIFPAFLLPYSSDINSNERKLEFGDTSGRPISIEKDDGHADVKVTIGVKAVNKIEPNNPSETSLASYEAHENNSEQDLTNKDDVKELDEVDNLPQQDFQDLERVESTEESDSPSQESLRDKENIETNEKPSPQKIEEDNAVVENTPLMNKAPVAVVPQHVPPPPMESIPVPQKTAPGHTLPYQYVNTIPPLPPHQITLGSSTLVNIHGIEGASNSSYMDSSLLSLFLPWSMFSQRLNDFSSKIHNKKGREAIRFQLQNRILFMLHQNGEIELSSEVIPSFRKSLSSFNPNFLDGQIDPEYFITTLFKDIIGSTPFYFVDGGEPGYAFQTFAPSTTNQITVRQLFQGTMERSQILLKGLPSPGFIIKLPVTNGQREIGRIFPNFLLNMKGFISDEWKGPTEMILGAVICLENNHFTTFIRPNEEMYSGEWRYIDSCKFGEVKSLHNVEEILSNEDNVSHAPDPLVDWMITHSYICIYFPR